MASTSALQIRDLGFRYKPDGNGPWTVRVRALELSAGEQALLAGPSGQGKSTLLYLIAGLLDPQQGRVLVHGEEIHALRGAHRDRFRGQRIGMVFQTFHLLPGFSALQNVMAALMFSNVPGAEHRARAERLLRELGIDAPEAPVEELSVGQQQRVAVARALACEPALVLADEPTASLDPAARDAAMALLQGACRAHEAALLVVRHDAALAARFDRELTLSEASEQPEGAAAP